MKLERDFGHPVFEILKKNLKKSVQMYISHCQMIFFIGITELKILIILKQNIHVKQD